MAVDGTWKVVVESPMGAQEGTLVLKTDGGAVTGTQKTSQGSMAVQNGKVAGDKLSWTGEITQPFAMKLEFSAMVTGDELKGEVKAGTFGTWPMTGKRVA